MITPQKKANKLAKNIGLTTPLYLKREDLHPLLSHKGRSLPYMIEIYIAQGHASFVVSSSGNAALAAGLFIKKYNQKNKDKLMLKIFVGENIDNKKLRLLKKLQDKNISITKTKNPKQNAFQMNKNKTAKLLRQSTDDLALVGYKSLARELSQIKNISAIFIPTSSGTTAQGLYEAFQKLKITPQIHIVQTTACHPLAEEFSKTKNISQKSLANAIVDKVAHRKEKIIAEIKNSHGFGWIADNKQIEETIKITQQAEKIKLSPNSALSIVGLRQAIKNNWNFTGPIVCLVTGA